MALTGNALKNKALGMPYGTAASKLRKILLFELSKNQNLDKCFRCGRAIINLEDFSIDHKQSWLFSEDPVKYFFDPTNIAFSHLKCNVLASSSGFKVGHSYIRKKEKRLPYSSESWCSMCKLSKPISKFGANKSKSNQLATECLDCRKLRSLK